MKERSKDNLSQNHKIMRRFKFKFQTGKNQSFKLKVKFYFQVREKFQGERIGGFEKEVSRIYTEGKQRKPFQSIRVSRDERRRKEMRT